MPAALQELGGGLVSLSAVKLFTFITARDAAVLQRRHAGGLARCDGTHGYDPAQQQAQEGTAGDHHHPRAASPGLGFATVCL
jgi:hypothetical protein